MNIEYIYDHKKRKKAAGKPKLELIEAKDITFSNDPHRIMISQEDELAQLRFTADEVIGFDDEPVREAILKLDAIAPNRPNNAAPMGYLGFYGNPVRNPYKLVEDIVHMLSVYVPDHAKHFFEVPLAVDMGAVSKQKKTIAYRQTGSEDRIWRALAKTEEHHKSLDGWRSITALIWAEILKHIGQKYLPYEFSLRKCGDAIAILAISEFYMEKLGVNAKSNLPEKAQLQAEHAAIVLASYDVLGDHSPEFLTASGRSEICRPFAPTGGTSKLLRQMEELKFAFTNHSSAGAQ